ncbi:MAG: branched-chain amino acid ABC transporter permease [Nitrospirae bacterium]|nr:branched-chain amino acid ABC transporter permease [Magnetococcales bacterium]
MILQLFFNALLTGSLYALTAVAFTILYRVLGFFHFGVGLYYTMGAYYAYSLYTLGTSHLLAGIGSILLTGTTGLGLDLLVFRTLRQRKASSQVELLASIGIYIIGQNLISLMFRDNLLSIRGSYSEIGIFFGSASLTSRQLLIILSAQLAIIIVMLWLKYSQFGLEIRALANNESLAKIMGLPVGRILALTVFLGSGLAGFAGFLASLDQNIFPTMGMPALLMAVAAKIVGGDRSLAGVINGAMLIALLQSLSLLILPAAWQDALVFLLMIFFLIFFPSGIPGIKDTQKAESK